MACFLSKTHTSKVYNRLLVRYAMGRPMCRLLAADDCLHIITILPKKELSPNAAAIALQRSSDEKVLAMNALA